ncbi:MAG: phosphate signaling complex protein PhoU [Eubacteriales bacterium]|nr:phosphate signaling complex protein PhoU [Eubacteriales bacterium]
MTRMEYDHHLNELKHEIIRMSSLVEELLAKSMKALVEQDIEEAEEIIESDDVIDDLQNAIEEQCITLIATQQPLAGDLRIIFAAIKMATDLERIADYGVGIAKTVIRLKDEEYIKPLIDLPRMTDIACEMLKKSVQAFANKDVDLAMSTAKMDNKLDQLFRQIYRELLTYVMESPRHINQMMSFVLIARYLERVGDHITNICEWIVYNATGKRLDLD